MIRLNIVVEGQTEETFVRVVLAPELAPHSIFATAHSVTTSRDRGKVYRGGFVSYAHLRKDLNRWIRQDQSDSARFTTMVDLYRMPKDAPGFEESRKIADPVARAQFLERSISQDLEDGRFRPYIQVHEFEALLFAAPAQLLTAFPGSKLQIDRLITETESFATPEHIDNGESTSPAKRISAALPEYAKSVDGPIITRQIGLAALRAKCPHFEEWWQALCSCHKWN